MTVKETAIKLLDCTSEERYNAEKMMGCKFRDMTPSQRLLTAQCIAALGTLIESVNKKGR